VKTRILLVDDHDLMRDGLRAVLEKEPGLEVVGEAATGRQAVARAEVLRPDVVIMDVAMRDLNGIEATKRIHVAMPEVRIVALSSHTQRSFVTSILRAGASAYVLKANAYSQLRRAVQSVLAGRSFLCEEIAGVMVEELRRSSSEAEAAGPLSSREREIVQLVAEGHSSGEIASQLHVSPNTVETHRRNIMRKLGLHGVADLTRYAIREGIASAED